MSNINMKVTFASMMLVAVVVAFVTCVFPAVAAEPEKPEEPRMAVVSIYQVAPGQHAAFLEWMAVREEISKELGLPTGQWYAHADGDRWDYVAIAPTTTDEEDAKIEEAAAAKGLTTGFKAALELRKMIASHTDTFAWGPVSAAKLAAAAGGCCQCSRACQDVTRSSQCRGLCGPGGGTYFPGQSCVRNTCQ